MRPAEISVLLPAYNAEAYILGSVQSVLAQTQRDFELIVVNDCSTDRTAEILAGIRDDRLRVLDNPANLGVVGSLNHAMAHAAGRYVARIDADDYCTPTRFARQKAFLDAHERAVLVGTEMSVLSGGQVRFSRARADADPLVLRWMFHVYNPIGHPSMMFRADAVQRLGAYLSEKLKYAEDFDFSHRMLGLGELHVLPEYLTIYRQHERNLTKVHRDEMILRVGEVLRRVYADLLDAGADDADAVATLVAEHLFAGQLMRFADEFDRLRTALDRLSAAFVARYRPALDQRAAAARHNAALWDRIVRQHLVAGHLRAGYRGWSCPPEGQPGPPVRSTAITASAGLLRPIRPAARAVKHALTRVRTAPRTTVRLNDTVFEPLPVEEDHPPTLYVVVDTEAEFDWQGPMDRSETQVSSAAAQELAQSIFDAHGIRPVYVVDHAIASQPEGYEPLRAILHRRGCVIGAHLHPWTTPPFEEEVSERNSFAGNLPPDLEDRKLRTLVATIERSFGIRPLFYKAGRYGLSAATMEILQRLGFQVDFSVLPLADLRGKGGPDFRGADTYPYETQDGAILSIPMMRGQTGLLAPVSTAVHGALHSDFARRLRLPGLLSRTGLLNTATLTPEGMTVREQLAMLRAMHGRGHRVFVLHYHSPSLGAHTPYVRTEADRAAFLDNIAAVCRFFLGEFGGLAGNPVDLLPTTMRERAWPAPACADA